MIRTEKLNTVLIGNPGVGKSTFLNAFLKEVRFKSGVAIGKGLTSVCQKEVDAHGNTYIDTPGLSDIKLRKQAAQEIKKALQNGGFFKIFFVITLEEGRIRPDDKTTMKLVLDAAPIDTMYSIIVNKLQPEVMELLQDKQTQKELITMLNEDLPGTTSIFFNGFDSKLSAKPNVMAVFTPEFFDFMLKAPTLIIKPEEVKEIKSDNFEEIKAMLMAQIEELRNNAKSMREAMDKERDRYEKMMKKQKEYNERLSREHQSSLQEIRRSYASQFEVLKSTAEQQQKQIETQQEKHQRELQELKQRQSAGPSTPPPKEENIVGRIATGVLTLGISELVRLF